jgi:glycosyltransferase involved in cell wall biosynthesis
MCTEWVKRGYKVTVLTGIPNYPQGKFYDGYGYTKNRRESWNGMEIVRIPLIPRGNNAFGMVCNYLSFVVSGFFWKMFTCVEADYVFMFEVSPMTQALVGVWYAKKHKIPCYLYVQDLWPENVESVTDIHSKLILEPIGKMVDYIYKRCDKIFATSESFVKEIVKRNVPEQKVEFWPQYAEEFYRPLAADDTKEEKFVVTFTGNIGVAQGLDILPKVAEILKEQNCKVKFKIVGDGRYKDEFVNEIEKRNVSELFELTGRKPVEEIPTILAESDAAFLSFMDNPLFAKTIPAKLQSYMACGVPIIASATGESKRIIEEADCGICCAIGDVVQLADSIVKMIHMGEIERKMMGKNARAYCEGHFDKKTLMDYMERYFAKRNEEC